MKITAAEIKNYAVLHGRTYLCDDALWTNWSCTGFTCRFTGTYLRANFVIIPNQMKGPFAPPEGAPMEYPAIGMLEPDAEDFIMRRTVEEDGWVELFSGEEGDHTLRFMKVSENSRGKCGIIELETDGEFIPVEAKPGLSIDVIGDSITCGYGNESNKPGFRTYEENGWQAYGARAAREIGADYTGISISGASVANLPTMRFPAMLPGLSDFYAYTDRLLETVKGQTEYQPWDFAANPRDAVVINLGTNDSNMVCMSGDDIGPGLEAFRENYKNFIANIRRLNGPSTVILCTLGCMDYFLWDEIRDVVDAYVAETGDKKVFAGKYCKTKMFTEGMGADGHPSLKSHERMGHELASMLKKYLEL